MVTTSKWNSPLQGIKFPRGGSSGMENGLNNLGWETWVYEAGPHQRPSPQFPQFWLGVKYRAAPLGTEGPSWREAPEEAHQEGILYLGTILCPATAGNESSRTRSNLSPGIPGAAERLGKMHTDEASATSAPSLQSKRSWMCEGEPEWTVSCPSRRKQIHLYLAELPPYRLHQLRVEPQFPGPQPLSRPDVCSYIVDLRDVSCSQRQQLPLRSQEDLACQFARDVTANPPGNLCRRPPMCCLSRRAHGGPWANTLDLLGNS